MRRLSGRLESAGRTDASSHAAGRPPVAETEAVGRALELALATGVRVHIVHATVERAFTLVQRAREDGAAQQMLAKYGCDSAQGYFISRPLPADEMLAWMGGPERTPAQIREG